jgi:DNA-binding CsgD family transcriptional regulator
MKRSAAEGTMINYVRNPQPAQEPAAQASISDLLFELSGICMSNLDPELRVAAANKNFLRQFELPSSEVSGRSFEEFLHPSVSGLVRRQLNTLLEGKRSRLDAPIVALRPDGSAFSGALTGLVARGSSGAPRTVTVLVKPEDAGGEGSVVIERGRALSEIDARILEGVAAGIPSTQLSMRLYMSRQGVEYHIAAMLRKFRARNRSALVSRAYSLGILSVGIWPPQVPEEYVR